METKANQQRSFLLLLISFCGFYFAMQCILSNYTRLYADDFWFAHTIYHYKNNLPYRDFSPYKTVLGYYLLLPAMLTKQSIIQTLIFTKNTIAAFNTLALFFSSWWLTKFFSHRAVLVTLLLILISENVLHYSTNIRVDLIGYWFCLFSLLLLENRYWLAGIVIGLGFITTQKTLWYIFASNCALASYGLFCQRDRKMFWNIVSFDAMAGMVIIIYLAFWAWLSSWNTVLHNVFYEASIMYQLNWYASSRLLFWSTIAAYHPFFFLSWPITLLTLMISIKSNPAEYRKKIFITVYAFTILFCLIPYKQVFPYYMQVTIPIFLVLSSLNEDPHVTQDTVIADLKKSLVKFYVNNYRMQKLPKKLKVYLASQYQHLWGSIYLYAPEVLAGQQTYTLKFSGNYRLESDQLNEITLNGKHYKPNSVLSLTKGQYISISQKKYKLKIIPENIKGYLLPEFQQDYASEYFLREIYYGK